MPDLHIARSACLARIANAERSFTHATEKYEAEITAQAIGNAADSASALDKRMAELATKKDDALKWLERERAGLAGIEAAIEAEARQAAELLAEAKAAAQEEILTRLHKAALKAASAIRKAGDDFADLVAIARELGPISDGQGGSAGLNGSLEPLVQGATIEVIRAGLGAQFPNAADVLLRRNESVDYGLVGAAKVIRHRATGGGRGNADDDQAEAA